MTKEYDYGDEYKPKVSTHGGQEILSIPLGVRFYLTRLDELLTLKEHLSSEQYPVEYYNGIPIKTYRNNWHELGGLSWGVEKSILGARRILSHMGYKKETETYLKLRWGQENG